MTRKTFLTILVVSIVTVLISVSPAHPSPYAIYQITNNSSTEDRPQINDNGYVVWDADGEIFLYDGTSITQITNYGGNPQINNKGYVVWEGYDGSDYEIFLYDGMNTIQLTDNSYYDGAPEINDNGHVVWQGWDGHDYEIFLYDGTSISNISNNFYDDWSPQINNNGYVVWYGSDGSDWEIFLYDGTSISNISNNSYNDYDPQINNNAYVVWYGYDGHDYEIFFYNGMNTIQLTNNLYDDEYFHINDDGYVVWYGYGSDYGILFLYDGNSIKRIIYGGSEPRINNVYVVWNRYDGNDFEIFLYDGTNITQLTNNSYDDFDPQINNNGHIVWLGYNGTDSEVFLAIPTLALNAPTGGETIPSGSTHSIQWSASPEMEKFDLYYSLNNGTTWSLIASKVTGSRYDWTVPEPTKNKKNCLVKVIGYDASDVKVGEDTSDGTFTIEVVKVTSPNEGEIWKVGSTHAITWTTNGTKKPVAKVKLFYTTNRGATWNFITTVISNPGSYNWKVPAAASANCKVKVVLKNALGKTMGTDVSDSFFTIGP